MEVEKIEEVIDVKAVQQSAEISQQQKKAFKESDVQSYEMFDIVPLKQGLRTRWASDVDGNEAVVKCSNLFFAFAFYTDYTKNDRTYVYWCIL